MIVILADDFSGAAELAGIAAACGFTAEVQTEFDPSSKAEVIAIDTNTRTKAEPEAQQVVRSVCQKMVAAQPAWVFKKTDSVLRGHVRAEIEAILDVMGKSECLLIPANPSKNRVIINGEYFIEGVPLDQTVFANDPDFPRRSANVQKLVGPSKRIRIPDARMASDLSPPSDSTTLAAGGADFFAIILGRKSPRPQSIKRESIERILLVCGSLAAWETGRVAEVIARGFSVHLVPDLPSSSIWQITNRLMIAVGPKSHSNPNELVRDLITAAVSLSKDPNNLTLALEGGATALAFIQRMGWTRFEVLPYGHIGVGTLYPPGGPLICVKPGSYPWPQSLF